MAHAEHHFDAERLNEAERVTLGDRGTIVFGIAAVVGALGLVGAIVLGFFKGDGFRQFYFAYLTAFAFFASIAVGGLAFVLIQHISRAGWSASVRRVAELLAATFPVIAVLSLPILVSVVTGKSGHPNLYRWAQPLPEGGVEHHATAGGAQLAAAGAPVDQAGKADALPEVRTYTGEYAEEGGTALDNPANVLHGVHAYDGQLDDMTLAKRPWLNPPFFVIRMVAYFLVFCGVALFYWRTSVRQDTTGDVADTHRMQNAAGPLILLSGVTLTLFAFDLLMTLDPHWYSTMFGVYYLAGSFVAGWATIIVILNLLQGSGYLKQSVSKEHFHDLGKYLFGFVFFWGYIAFSQYMLIWYANLPETTVWFARRGATTALGDVNVFSWVAIILLACHLLIPFAGLLSRHVKRFRPGLLFWAVWLLVFHYIDLIWIVKPELNFINGIATLHEYSLQWGLLDICCMLGIGGVFVAAWVKLAGAGALRPLRDPRLHEAVAFHNL